MKKIQLFISVVLIALFAGHATASAQTYHEEISGVVYAPVFCLEKVVTGYLVYRITYHVDKKTGEITSVHWTIKDARLVDEDQNAYKVIDTGSDNYGIFHEFWNTINTSNATLLEALYPGEGYSIVYTGEDGDVLEDGWMEGTLSGEYEGILTNSFKMIGKHGEKVSYHEVTVYHIDKDGNVILDFSKVKADCNW
jgi:hypothetical protein